MPVPPRRPLSSVLVLVTVLAVGLGALAAPASAKRYTPSPGVTTNNPLGDFGERRAITRHILRSIDASRGGSKIRVASWNIRSDDAIDALVRAHKRDVTVRVILSRGNANPENRNVGIDRLERALQRSGNAKRSESRRSGLSKCVRSCRGRSGIAHSKFFLFSKAGKARHVVINGSFNLTDLAASHQWNDVYTTVGRTKVYREFRETFRQMFRDKRVKQGYRAERLGKIKTMMYPYTGKKTRRAPILKELAKTRCSGARYGTNGRTRIRIAMTSWHGQRGINIASRLRQMQNRGCDVKIIYAVMGNEVLRILRKEGRRPVPMRQIVQDFNGDGVYDRYLHTKVMTINGRHRGDRAAWVTINGSANWSPAALASDEAVMKIQGRKLVGRYNTWMDRWFRNPPRSRPVSAERRAAGPVDPYANIQPD
ncbi:phosphatidylserine/phosphatidylglycerophosphate/cardiolipin synthase family protein [Nocardioides sp.]|uniref:phospholipase D-like domain-containing protein n=1 Tax=Nocardioides sp. TaxID=35761 RepID=UPI0035628715